tara:strand:- start:839 stop:1516 length:678 start_codon:yes stop_codon:yes gene_type:complete
MKKEKFDGFIIESQSFIKKTDELEDKKIKLEKERSVLLEQRSLNKKIISIEDDLNKLPVRGIGSIFIYNMLNEKFSFFEVNQFNKLIRFLTFVEIKENEYSTFLKKTSNNYYKSPDTEQLNVLKNSYNQLNSFYKILMVCCDSVDIDKVTFNKLFNMLEDEGYFLSVPEKENIEHLKNIISGLNNVMDSIDSFRKESNENLREISHNLIDMDMNLWDISGSLRNL